MRTKAAVLVQIGAPLEIADLTVPPLRRGQVLVDVAFSGVCRTQLMEARGYRGPDIYLPHCLGHEGSGVVRQVGEGVTKVREGDRVILSWIRGSGIDAAGPVYKWNGRAVNAGAITTFSRQVVASENRLTRLPSDINMQDAALLGCAVPTGVGAVINAARAAPGQSITIFGTGAVGLCAIQAAAVTRCAPIIAVDVKPERLSLAVQLGATHAIDASSGVPAAAIRQLVPEGTDIAIEATGRPEAMVSALASVRSRGGRAVVIGNAQYGQTLTIDPRELNLGKSLVGTWGGDAAPDKDFPYYCDLIGRGALDLKPLMRGGYALEDINRALDDLEAGLAIRPMLDMTGADT